MTTATVERRAAVEFRFDGGRITGPAVTYGEIAQGPKGPERFEPQAWRSGLDTAALNLQHDRDRVLDPAPIFEDSVISLDMRAMLRREGAEAALVRRGALRGLSVGFVALEERTESGVRVISGAHLDHVALVDRPAYAGSTVELRQDLGFLGAVIPYNRDMECTCQGPECSAVRFLPGAFDQVLNRTEAGRDVLAIAGRATEVLGSLRRGTLRVANASRATLRAVDAPRAKVQRGIEVMVEQAITRAAATVIANAVGAPWYVRPLIRQQTSQYLDLRGVRHYSKADLRGFLVKPTVNDRGQLPAVIEGRLTGPIPPALALTGPPERRRIWL